MNTYTETYMCVCECQCVCVCVCEVSYIEILMPSINLVMLFWQYVIEIPTSLKGEQRAS